MIAATPLREVTLVLPMAADMELVASQAAAAVAAWIGMPADRVDPQVERGFAQQNARRKRRVQPRIGLLVSALDVVAAPVLAQNDIATADTAIEQAHHRFYYGYYYYYPYYYNYYYCPYWKKIRGWCY